MDLKNARQFANEQQALDQRLLTHEPSTPVDPELTPGERFQKLGERIVALARHGDSGSNSTNVEHQFGPEPDDGAEVGVSIYAAGVTNEESDVFEYSIIQADWTYQANGRELTGEYLYKSRLETAEGMRTLGLLEETVTTLEQALAPVASE